ncbi:MAG: RNase H family protein [bacterium]
MITKKKEIIIYTDGSSLGNPGPGGWGAVIIINNEKVIEIGGREKESTNNRMEITGVLEALLLVEKRKPESKKIIIHTDSSYVLNSITGWIHSWVKNDWKTKLGDPVLNKDLWEKLYKVHLNLKNKYEIDWIKVSGHSGVHLNERCDGIATSFSANNTTILFTGTLKNYEKLFGEITTPSRPKVGTSLPNKEGGVNKIKNKSKIAYSYVSTVAGKVHADKTWTECEKRVKGKSGAKYKKVFSKEEEQELIALWSLKSLF